MPFLYHQFYTVTALYCHTVFPTAVKQMDLFAEIKFAALVTLSVTLTLPAVQPSYLL